MLCGFNVPVKGLITLLRRYCFRWRVFLCFSLGVSHVMRSINVPYLLTYLLTSLFLRQGGGYEISSVCLSFCLSIYMQPDAKRYAWIYINFLNKGTRRSWSSLKVTSFWR